MLYSQLPGSSVSYCEEEMVAFIALPCFCVSLPNKC